MKCRLKVHEHKDKWLGMWWPMPVMRFHSIISGSSAGRFVNISFSECKILYILGLDGKLGKQVRRDGCVTI